MTLKQSQTLSVEPVMGYKTSDGKMYATHKEALLEQHLLDFSNDLEAYLSNGYHNYLARYAILDWERYKKEKELKDAS